MWRRIDRRLWAPDNPGAGGTPAAVVPAATDDNGGEPPATRTWEAVLAALPEADRALYEQHTTGLRNTVQATRSERDALAQRLGDLTKALGKDSPEEARRLLGEMTRELETSRRRADFVEQAVRPEIGCTNPAAAFAIAESQGLFDARGNVNWDGVKRAVPELFRRPVPPGNAGAGTGQPPGGAGGMNAAIRRATGRA